MNCLKEKHKAIAIPVSFVDDKPRFLTVRDRRFQEWIFVTGGCRKSEIANPLRCALRELEEESRLAVRIRHGTFSYFNFHVTDSDDENIELIYHVYIIPFNINKESQTHIINRFYSEKLKTEERKLCKLSIRRTHDENDMLNFETLDDFNEKNRWNLITENIIKNPEFYKCVNSPTREYF